MRAGSVRHHVGASAAFKPELGEHPQLRRPSVRLHAMRAHCTRPQTLAQALATRRSRDELFGHRLLFPKVLPEGLRRPLMDSRMFIPFACVSLIRLFRINYGKWGLDLQIGCGILVF